MTKQDLKQLGTLILVPTPIGLLDETTIDQKTQQQLLYGSNHQGVFLWEEPKPARRRWLSWGLGREHIDSFLYYNEQSQDELLPIVLNYLMEGRDVYLISDGGLPAFCDPGRSLVRACHERGIQVTATSFSHSVALALAMSGFQLEPYIFMGFVPRKPPYRQSFLKNWLKSPMTAVVMDTPYRLSSLLKETSELVKTLPVPQKTVFYLATDLNKPSEECYFGEIDFILKSYLSGKKEFILIKENHE